MTPEKFLDPRWQKISFKILERDQWTCQACRNTDETLAVYLRYFEKNQEPWEHPDDALITLCPSCLAYEGPEMENALDLLNKTLRKRFFGDDVLEIATAFEFGQYDSKTIIKALKKVLKAR